MESPNIFDYINSTYSLNVIMDVNVKMDGKKGVIKGVQGPHVLVLFDDEKYPLPCHPTWKMEYLP